MSIPRYGDVSSKIYPVYARHKPGASSSATTPDSERLITPTDNVLPTRHFSLKDPTTARGGGQPEVLGHDYGTSNSDDEVARGTEEQAWADETLDLPNELDSIFEQDPYGPYFSQPRPKDVPPSALIRRGTAKELIGRYQSMEDDALSYRTSTTPTSETKSTRRRQMPRGGSVSPDKDKKRSPIRQSIRNFLSAFKTKKSGASRENLGRHLSVPESMYDAGDGFEAFSSDAPLGSASARLEVDTGHRHVAPCTTPISPRNTGPLLYLSAPTSSDTHPVWVSCTATLHSRHMLIITGSAQGHPSTEMLPFSKCIDVRSLSMNDLEPDERSLLPSGPELNEIKIFELIFEGRQSERFAAKSVAERAKWVSSVW